MVECVTVFDSIVSIREELKKRRKKIVEFSTLEGSDPTHPPPLVEKNKTKNVLYVMKRILYDMGHLTVAKWLLFEV